MPQRDDDEAVRATQPLEAPPPAEQEPAQQAGQRDSRYEPLRLLALGGMGRVVECQDAELRRRVAVKALRTDLPSDPAHVAMLEREARVTGSLEHPNIIPIYDLAWLPGGGRCYAMRIVDQPSLDEVIGALAHGEPGAAAEHTLGRLLRYFIQVCQAVDYAHSRGVVHCDLKPANVLLGSFGEVLVVDWGLAYLVAERTVYRGGTPGYMAPEQLDMSRNRIDPRTDVFALGAILYEILTLKPAYPTSEPAATMWPAPPPRQVAPDRRIPEELEDICMRALATEADERFPSAKAMAEALEAFLEGTRERERRMLRAAALIRQAEQFAASYREFVDSRPELCAEVERLRVETTPWAGPEGKRPLWDAEDRLAVTDALAVRTLQAAVSSFEQALDEVPGHVAARRGLARLYFAQLERARERRDELDRVYFDELVKQYDDGTLVAGASSEGWLTASLTGEVGQVEIALYEERDRRLVPAREWRVPARELARLPLPSGSYVATLRPGVRAPFLIRGGQETRLTIDLAAAGAPEPGEAFVAGGPSLLGGDEGLVQDLRDVHVPSFFLAELPVIYGDYLDFLADVLATDEAAGARYAPRTREGAPLWRWTGDGFVVAEGIWGRAPDETRTLPVFGVDIASAEAYADWLSRKRGRRYRLPNEHEWEKAARGVDGRRYPWGNHFDASFCKMRDSRPDAPRPEPVGTFAIDVSPYGVRDMAGSIAEWVVPTGPSRVDRTDPGGTRPAVSRGGAWCDWQADCRLSTRRSYRTTERSLRLGFRLARSV